MKLNFFNQKFLVVVFQLSLLMCYHPKFLMKVNFFTRNFFRFQLVDVIIQQYHSLIPKFLCQIFLRVSQQYSWYHPTISFDDTKIFMLMSSFKFSCWCYHSNFLVDVFPLLKILNFHNFILSGVVDTCSYTYFPWFL